MTANDKLFLQNRLRDLKLVLSNQMQLPKKERHQSVIHRTKAAIAVINSWIGKGDIA